MAGTYTHPVTSGQFALEIVRTEVQFVAHSVVHKPPSIDWTKKLFTSALEIFKIGVGPSSSHTIGPMVAAMRFLDMLRESAAQAASLRVSLHGSLAFTGRGHSTDRAVMLGLCGIQPETYVAEEADSALSRLRQVREISPSAMPALRFDPDIDLVFDYEHSFAEHPNGLAFHALDASGKGVFEETFFSIGGGFIVTRDEFHGKGEQPTATPVPYPFRSAAQLLELARASGKSIAEVMAANECSFRAASETETALERIWLTMDDCIERGLAGGGNASGRTRGKAACKGNPRKAQVRIRREPEASTHVS